MFNIEQKFEKYKLNKRNFNFLLQINEMNKLNNEMVQDEVITNYVDRLCSQSLQPTVQKKETASQSWILSCHRH